MNNYQKDSFDNNSGNYNSKVNDFYSFSDNDSYYSNNNNNSYYNNSATMSSFGEVVESNQSKVVARSFLVLCAVMLLSGITAIISADSVERLLNTNKGAFVGVLLVELVVVIIANLAMSSKNDTLSIIMLVVYSIVSGYTLSAIFTWYDFGSIASIFFVCAVMFAVLGIVGSTTKKTLSTIGAIGIMLLVGVLIATLLNIFVGSQTIDFAITIVGLAAFVGLTAYDFQRIKELGASCTDDEVNTLAMYGALMLYLDFINLFLKLLRLFARARD